MTAKNRILQSTKNHTGPATGAPAPGGKADDGSHWAADGEQMGSQSGRAGRSTTPRRGRNTERELRRLCVDAAAAATRRLIKVALDPLTPEPIAIAQCKEILDRAYGRTRDLEPLEEQEPVTMDLSGFSYEELEQFEKFYCRAYPGLKKL